MSTEQDWWFPRKAFGFGWGFPTRWQGWVTSIVYLIAMTAGVPLAGQRWGHPAALVLAGAATAGLLIVLLIKGEPLREGAREEGAPKSPARAFRAYRLSSYVIAVAFLLLSIPLALRWIPQNPWYGFRVPSTLSGTPAHWFRVNEVAGLAGIVAGLVAILTTLMMGQRRNPPSLWKGRAMLLLTLGFIIAASLAPLLIR